MKHEHTPGPWQSHRYNGNEERFFVGAGDSWFLADVYDGNGSYSAEANARLIAAAPAMLETLENVEQNMQSDRFVDPTKREMYLSVIRAAIAEARGEDA